MFDTQSNIQRRIMRRASHSAVWTTAHQIVLASTGSFTVYQTLFLKQSAVQSSESISSQFPIPKYKHTDCKQQAT